MIDSKMLLARCFALVCLMVCVVMVSDMHRQPMKFALHSRSGDDRLRTEVVGLEEDHSSGARPVDDIVHTFQWAPGGCRGSTAEDIETDFVTLVEKSRATLVAKDGVCSATFQERLGQSVAMQSLLQTLSSDFVRQDARTPQLADCRAVLTPYHRAVCVVSAAMDDESFRTLPLVQQRDIHESSRSSFNRNSTWYRQSYCGVVGSCMDWARGRFSHRLSEALLGDVFYKVVLPRFWDDTHRVSAAREFGKQLVHGEGNDAEVPWLEQRHRTAEYDLWRRAQWAWEMFLRSVKKQPSASASSKRGRRSGDGGVPHFGRPTPMRDMFQGRRMIIKGRQNATMLLSDNDTHTVNIMTLHRINGLEAMATLWWMLQGEVELSDSTSASRINVAVFAGDSVTRETFERLIRMIRYGADPDPPTTDANDRRRFPNWDFSSRYDQVYAIYPEYDELLGFDSVMSNASSTNTVESFFLSIVADLTTAHKRGDATGLALIYIVCYWDPFTEDYRGLGFPVRNATPLLLQRPRTSLHQLPLSAIGVDVALMVQGNHFWEPDQHERLTRDLTRVALQPSSSLSVAVGGESRRRIKRRLCVMTSVGDDKGPDTPLLYIFRIMFNDEIYSTAKHSFIPRNYTSELPLPDDVVRFPIPEIPDATFFNSVKRNRRLFRWHGNVSRVRDERNNADQTDGEQQQQHPHAASHHRSFHYDTVHLLDKSKLQFLGDAFGDYRHFSSYAAIMCGSVGHDNFVEALVTSRAFNALILTPDVAYDNQPRMCNGKWSSRQLIDFLQQLNRRNESMMQTMWKEMVVLTQCFPPQMIVHSSTDEAKQNKMSSNTNGESSAHLGFVIPTSMMLAAQTTHSRNNNIIRPTSRTCCEDDAVHAAALKASAAANNNNNTTPRLLYGLRLPRIYRRQGEWNPGDGNLLQALFHNVLLTTTSGK